MGNGNEKENFDMCTDLYDWGGNNVKFGYESTYKYI